MMASYAYDAAYLIAASDELEQYLLSSVLYWPLSSQSPKGEAPFLRLTIGGILLSQQRISGWASGEVKSDELVVSEDKIRSARSRWRSNWNKKAGEEIKSRWKQWENFLSDYRKDPSQQVVEYPRKIYLRVVLQLLHEELDGAENSERLALSVLDRQLRASFKAGDFCWDEPLQGAFPPDKFWYLYGSLK